MRRLLGWALAALWCAPLAAADLDAELRDLEDFSRALSVIESQALYPREHKELIDAAITGMLADLDPYSRLLDAEGFERVRKMSQGQSFGVGLSLEPQQDRLRISRVIEGTPADRAGLERGQSVVEVNGQGAEQLDAVKAREMGEQKWMSLFSRRPRSRSSDSMRRATSSGAGGHL